MRFIDFNLEKYNVNIHVNFKNLLKLIVIICFFIILSVYYIKTMYRSLNLDKNGTQITATVTNYGMKVSKQTITYVEYTFKINNSSYSSYNTILNEDFWSSVGHSAKFEDLDKIAKTNTIDILFLTDNPKINKPAINKYDLIQYLDFSFTCLILMLLPGFKSLIYVETIYEDYILTKKNIRKKVKKREVTHYFLWDIEKPLK